MEGTPRPLRVLGAFQPFGLTAERLQLTSKFSFSLFDSQLAQQVPSSQDILSDRNHDEELFIHENRVLWSAGRQVRKRFTGPSTVLQAVWCRFTSIMEPLLCILYSDSLATFTPAGEMTIVPLPYAVASLWPIPHGLLLQTAPSENSLLYSSMSTSHGSKLPNLNFHNLTEIDFQPCSSNFSHLILQHPLEELQALQYEKGAGLHDLVDANEHIMWTSNDISYVASYHKGTSKHSIWRVKNLQSEGLSIVRGGKEAKLHPFECNNSFSLQRVWEDEQSNRIADQVFLATGDDSEPILCFLMKDSKIIFAINLSNTVCLNNYNNKAWTKHAIAAVPVVATRPWLLQSVKQFDLITLSADGSLFLHRGEYQLCQLSFAWSVVSTPQGIPPDMANLHIVALNNPVQGRFNVVTSAGEVYRAVVCREPSSAFTASCMMALEQGLENPFRIHFISSLWRHTYSWTDDLTDWDSRQDGSMDAEWASFAGLFGSWCNSDGLFQQTGNLDSPGAWEYLLRSNMHKKSKDAYCGLPSVLPGRDTVSKHQRSLALCQEHHKDILTQVLNILHTVYENCKLDCLHWRDLGRLASLLSLVASALLEWNYVDHYARDFPQLFELLRGACSTSRSISVNLPFNIFGCLENIMTNGKSSTWSGTLPSLFTSKGSVCVSFSRKVLAFYEILVHKGAVTRTLPSGMHLTIANGSYKNQQQRLVLAMVGENFSLADLDRVPAGVSLLLRHALNSCREAPPSDWPDSAFVLVGREDLALMCTEKQTRSRSACLAAPYMLHLQPVPSAVCESVCYENINSETVSPVDKTSDGMEHMFNGVLQLRFGRDLRLNEVRRLLCSSRPVAVRMANPPDVSDPDMVAQQQAQLWQLAQRTTSLAFGRGAFTLATMRTLLTEVLTIPKLILAGRLPSQHDAMVNLDPNTGSLSDLTSWPEYHNGVASGLRLAPCQDTITRTWILYNRPEEPNFAHAGLLMALGLQGHLRALAATDVYRYLSQEHEATTVGILLGMAAAYRGTMDPAISKILYLHIPARHPPSFPELELPTLMQSAALMAVGILYQGSAHRLTTEILLAEIGRKPGSDNILEREGYALAAGLALGLVTLGKGNSAWGLADLSIEERLLYYMSGGSEPGEGRHLRYDLTSSGSFANSSRNLDDQYQNNGQVMEGSNVNLDVTAPGATLALGLMFLKTNCKEVAARLATPDTHFALEYVRPDFILIRVVARNLVLWDSVQATEEWIQGQVPAIVKEFLRFSTNDKESFNTRSAKVDMEALAQAHVNILAGACLSIGLRYAGTCSAEAQELLYQYALYFLKEKRYAAPVGGTVGPDGKYTYVDRGTLETCLNVAALSLCVVMAGSGHLGTFKLLRYLRRRNDAAGAISHGNHMAISMALGFLFLGGGMATFATNNNAVAALLIALYPRFPTAPNDHRCHLQAFRHLYMLASESRCVETVDVDMGLPVYVPVEITLKESVSHSETTFCQVTPCLFPERSVLKRVRVCGPRYWPQDIKLTPCGLSWWGPDDLSNPFSKGILRVKRKVGARSYEDDPIGCRSLLSRILPKSLRDVNASAGLNGNSEVDKVVTTFSADPSLRAFAQLICTNRLGGQFEEFCLQALLECVSSDKPALLQAYMSFYATVEELMCSARLSGSQSGVAARSMSICSLKVALTYIDVTRIKSEEPHGGPILQKTFLAALAIQIDSVLKVQQPRDCDLNQNTSSTLATDLLNYLRSFQSGHRWTPPSNPALLAFYLQWYNISCPAQICKAFEQLASFLAVHPSNPDQSFSLPLLALVLPGTATKALVHINSLLRC